MWGNGKFLRVFPFTMSATAKKRRKFISRFEFSLTVIVFVQKKENKNSFFRKNDYLFHKILSLLNQNPRKRWINTNLQAYTWEVAKLKSIFVSFAWAKRLTICILLNAILLIKSGALSSNRSRWLISVDYFFFDFLSYFSLLFIW